MAIYFKLKVLFKCFIDKFSDKLPGFRFFCFQIENCFSALFITNLSKKLSIVGGTLRDVQGLVGHKNLQTTQRYIDVDTDCQKELVNLI